MIQFVFVFTNRWQVLTLGLGTLEDLLGRSDDALGGAVFGDAVRGPRLHGGSRGLVVRRGGFGLHLKRRKKYIITRCISTFSLGGTRRRHPMVRKASAASCDKNLKIQLLMKKFKGTLVRYPFGSQHRVYTTFAKIKIRRDHQKNFL